MEDPLLGATWETQKFGPGLDFKIDLVVFTCPGLGGC